MKLRGHIFPDPPRELGNPPTQVGGLAPSPATGIDEYLAEHFRRFTQQLVEELDSHYRILHDQYTRSYVDHEEYNFTETPATKLDLTPQGQNPWRVRTILAYVGTTGANNQGMVRLGDKHRIVLPANQFSSTTVNGLRLTSNDVRRISSVVVTNGVPGTEAGGPVAWMYLGLFGEEIPTGALMWG